MTKETETKKGVSRREMMAASATGALVAGSGVASGLFTGDLVGKAHAAQGSEYNLAPGELDEYYGFWSSGQTVRCAFLVCHRCVN